MSCPVCGGAQQVTTTTAEAIAGEVAVLIERLPVLRCKDGHARVRDADRAAIREAVADQLAVADRRLLRGGRCADCSAKLSMPARRTRRSVTAVFETGATPATITFDLAMTRCPECALDQAPTGLSNDLSAALTRALA